jgi:carbamoyltransferase
MTRERPAVTLGIGGFLGHDGNAALVAGGEILFAAQEERYTRRKHDGRYPESAVEEALEFAGLSADAVGDVVFGEKHLQSRLFDRTQRPASAFSRRIAALLPERWEADYLAPARRRFPQARMHWAWHHLSHVAGAYYTSDCESAAFLCVDGKGEDYNATIGVVDARRLEILCEIPGENGLGLFYTLVTRYLGFPSFGSEYKVMGLAPYGEPRDRDALRGLVESDGDGGLRLRTPVRFFGPELEAAVGGIEERLGRPRRRRADPVEQRHADLAASLQAIFEEEIARQAAFARRLTGESQLLFTGGCAQNCVAAGKLRASGLFDEVHNSPVAGDMGSGLGAALLHQRSIGAIPGTRVDEKGFLLGGGPGEPPAEAAPFEVALAGDLFEEVAARLADGKIVAWCRGRMELGARALGARSIFADARAPGMQSRLNLAVKFREGFRPFAPVILEEELGAWFDSDRPSRYMQFVANLRPERRLPMPAGAGSMRERLDAPRAEIPSVVHVDYSARIQSAERATHPDLHRLLSAFRRRTGVPVLINTSFNVSGEPIVRTAAEAWTSFVHTDVDFLVIGDRLYRNPGQLTREEKMAWVRGFIESS